jgi:arylsulfatase A-like enzyme
VPPEGHRPNVVCILVDDMGYGDFSAFNGGLSSTPTLDALMQESVCLTQHYTGSPVCNPSRAALMTGRYSHRTGSLDTLEWWGPERLALRETTLADVFNAPHTPLEARLDEIMPFADKGQLNLGRSVPGANA